MAQKQSFRTGRVRIHPNEGPIANRKALKFVKEPTPSPKPMRLMGEPIQGCTRALDFAKGKYPVYAQFVHSGRPWPHELCDTEDDLWVALRECGDYWPFWKNKYVVIRPLEP